MFDIHSHLVTNISYSSPSRRRLLQYVACPPRSFPLLKKSAKIAFVNLVGDLLKNLDFAHIAHVEHLEEFRLRIVRQLIRPIMGRAILFLRHDDGGVAAHNPVIAVILEGRPPPRFTFSSIC